MDIRASLAALSASSGPSGREQQTLEQAMELLRQRLDEKNVYYMNPALNLQA